MSSTGSEVFKKSGIPREVLKWIQSLDLTFPIKNIRRDFSNGFLVAEMFSWYYPKDIEMHSFGNGNALPAKLGNWSQLERFFMKKNIGIPKELIDGTLHCKPGAAELLIQTIYTLLTNRIVRTLTDEQEVDFTDRAYQVRLPMHARSTASCAIKNNLKLTECMTEPNILTNKQKANAIITRHLEHRNIERIENPERFDIKPTLGEMARRLAPSSQDSKRTELTPAVTTSTAAPKEQTSSFIVPGVGPKAMKVEKGRMSSVQFREVKVQQMNKNNQMTVKPGSIHTVQTPVYGL